MAEKNSSTSPVNETFLRKALNGDLITVNGKKTPLLSHALLTLNYPLFEAALAAGAKHDINYSPNSPDKDQRSVKLADFLKQKVHENPLAYKPFYKTLKSHIWQQWNETFWKYLFRIGAVICVVGAIIANFFFALQSFIFAQETVQLVNMVFDNAATLGLIGFTFNAGFLAYKIHSNFTNPAKSLTNNITTLAYDVGTFLIKACGYASYLMFGVTPIAGMFFVTAFGVDASRGFIKLGRAIYNKWHYSCEYGTDKFNNDPIHATEIIRSNNRTNYKILTIISRTGISVLLTCVIAAYCFMPLTPLGTALAFTTMFGMMGVRSLVVGPFFNSIFESRAQSQIDAHLKTIKKPTVEKVKGVSTAHVLSALEVHNEENNPPSPLLEYIPFPVPFVKKRSEAQIKQQAFTLLAQILADADSATLSNTTYPNRCKPKTDPVSTPTTLPTPVTA